MMGARKMSRRRSTMAATQPQTLAAEPAAVIAGEAAASPRPTATAATASPAARTRSERRSVLIIVGIALLTAAIGLIYAIIEDEEDPPAREPVGTEMFMYEGGEHTETPVAFAEVPPVGGEHSGVWQNCGYYDGAVVSERAVHSLEHGAVWITYRPDLDAQQKATLEQIAGANSYVLVSAFPGLPSAVAVSAWNHQLVLESADDPRLGQFVALLQKTTEAPEPGAPCSGGSSDLAAGSVLDGAVAGVDGAYPR